jgi:hypothetical protein
MSYKHADKDKNNGLDSGGYISEAIMQILEWDNIK